MQETQVQSLGLGDPLEEEMATHSSILAWRTPWTEEPGRLQSLGSQKSQMQLTKQQQILLFQSVVDKSPLDSDQSKSFISRTGLGAIATPQKGP